MSESVNINDLFQNAKNEGRLSQASSQALDVVDIGEQIAAAMGVTLTQVPASEIVLVTMLVDDSGSIRFSQNAQLIRDGHNMTLEALERTQTRDSILVHTRYLNGYVLYPYCPVEKAKRMNNKNYDPSLGTPLYDQAVVVLGTVIAKAQSFIDNGIPARTVTLILTDGADAHSTRATEKTVKSLVKDMLVTENHIIAALGVDDGSTDFRKVFKSMGIEDRWILTAGNSQEEIRRAFNLFSRSVVAASKASGSFGQVSLGGFAA
ncbi:MAG: hypothetical protein RDV48_23465 [Candidatus Eremiobacteraeota bacterium]|nr:hypothetical protein [Candidatus Eremiobacteraeota bacterium]